MLASNPSALISICRLGGKLGLLGGLLLSLHSGGFLLTEFMIMIGILFSQFLGLLSRALIVSIRLHFGGLRFVELMIAVGVIFF